MTQHSEAQIKSIGARVFDIFIGNQRVQENVDIFKEMNFKSGFNTYTELELKNGKLLFNKKEIKNAFRKDPNNPTKVTY